MFNQKPCKMCGDVSHQAWRCPHRSFPPCKYCGKTNHASLACFEKPRGHLAVEAPKTRQKRLKTRRAWLKINPPDENGQWICYLRISHHCHIRVDTRTLNLEHVVAKVRDPSLKYEVTNLRPSCVPCNRLKGSRSLEELSVEFPHLRKYLSEPL